MKRLDQLAEEVGVAGKLGAGGFSRRETVEGIVEDAEGLGDERLSLRVDIA